MHVNLKNNLYVANNDELSVQKIAENVSVYVRGHDQGEESSNF